MEEDKNPAVGTDSQSQPEIQDLPPMEEIISDQTPPAVLEQETLPLEEIVEEKAEITEMKETEMEGAVIKEVATEETETEAKEVTVEEVGAKEDETEMEKAETKEDETEIKETKIGTVATKETEAKENENKINKKNIFVDRKLTIGAIIILILIVIAIFVVTKKSDQEKSDYSGLKIRVSSELEQGKVSIIEETKDDINVLTNNQTKTEFPVTEVIAFFPNNQKDPGATDCQRVFTLKKEIPKRYDSNILNSTLALLEPLTVREREAGYLSVIPSGTFLRYVKLDDSGVATANFVGAISKSAGSCAVSAIRAQITETLMQFASVKSVVICVDDNCREDEILQP